MEETNISGTRMSRSFRRKAWGKSSQCAVYGAGATYWVLRGSQFLGVAPLRFHKEESEWQIEVSTKQAVVHCVLGIVTTLAYFVGLLVLPFKDDKDDNELPRIIVFLTSAIIFGNAAAALVAVIGAKPRLEGIIHCLNTVQKIRKALSGKDTQSQTDKGKIAGHAAFCLLITYMICLRFAVTPTEQNEFKILFFFNSAYVEYNSCKIIALTMQFIQVTVEVRSALTLLNGCLHLIHLSNKSSIELESSSDEDQETIKKIKEIYHLFPQMIKQLDDCFGITVLLQSGICFSSLVVASYLLIISAEGDLMDVLALLNTMILYILLLIIMMETYHGLFRECMRTRSQVRQLLSTCCHERVAEQLGKLQLCLRLSDVTLSTTKLGSLSRVSILQKCSNVAAYILMIASFRDFDKTGQQ